MMCLQSNAKLIFVFTLVSVLFLLQGLSGGEDYSCLSQALSPAKVVRIDGTAIFVVVDKVSVKSVEKSISETEKCLQTAGWGGDIWSIVYFSDKKYAGYTAEPNIAKNKLSGWGKAYLALYEHSKGKLTLRPGKNPKIYYLDPAKKVKDSFSYQFFRSRLILPTSCHNRGH